MDNGNKKIKRREVAHAMGEVANADMRRRNVLAEVAHVRERCRARRLTSLNLIECTGNRSVKQV